VIFVQGSQGYGSTESDFVDIESFPSVPDTSLPELNLQVPVRLLQTIIVICQRGAVPTYARYFTSTQCCGSGMFIPVSDFYPSRIPDPKTATKERSEKNFFLSNLFM
jgi:hypothetical protein